jgi:hypothetical protein
MPSRDFQIDFKADTTNAIAGMQQLQVQLGIISGIASGGIPGMTQLNQQLSQLGANAQAATPPMVSAGKAANGMTESLVAMGAGMVLFQGGVAALQSFGQSAKAARQNIKDLADTSLTLLDAMREIASLKGAIGPDNAIAADVQNLALQAGYKDPKEAIKFIEQYEGSSPAGRQKKNITPDTEAKLMLEGARFGQRVKLDSKTAGDLTGVLSQYGKINNVEAGASMLGRIAHGLNEGRGNLEPLVRSLINTAGAVVGGPIEDLGELAAIQGVASTHANPRESGTRVRQAVRAMRQTSGEVGRFNQKTLKIQDADTHMQRIEKLKGWIDVGKANGKQSDIMMRNVGFTDEDEMRSILEEVEDFGIIKDRISQGKTKNTGKIIMEKDKRYQEDTITGQKGQADAKANQSKFLVGTNAQRFAIAKQNAETQMTDPKTGELGGTWNRVKDLYSDLGGIIPNLTGGMPSRERRINDKALENARTEARRLGIPEEQIDHRNMIQRGVDSTLGRLPVVGDMYKSLARGGPTIGAFLHGGDNAEFNRLADKIQHQPGGNPYGPGPDLKDKVDVLIRTTQETNRILQENANRAAHSPPPALPPTAPGAARAPAPPLRATTAPKRS